MRDSRNASGAGRSQVPRVERFQQVELLALRLRPQLVVGQITDHFLRIRLRVVEMRALMLGRQKSGAPQRLAVGRIAQGDEPGQVPVFAAQSVRNPGAERGAGRGDVAGVNQVPRGRVRRIEGEHRADDAKVVHDLRGTRQKLADLDSALSASLEGERGRQQPARHALRSQVGGVGASAFVLQQGRLGIEQIDLRRPSGHEQKNDVLGFWGEMRPGRTERVRCRRRRLQRIRETQRPEPAAERFHECRRLSPPPSGAAGDFRSGRIGSQRFPRKSNSIVSQKHPRLRRRRF